MTPPRPPLRLVDNARPAGDANAPGTSPEPPGEDAVIDAEFPAGDAVADDPPRTPLPPRFIVLGLIAFQLIGALSYAGKYVDLTRTETVSPAAAILSAPALACLCIGALLLALRPGRGRAWFLAAAVGLGVSIPFWGISYSWTWPVAFGAMLGLAGAWYARAADGPPDETTAAQP